MTDTVGFIQKLPTTLVAAFRATLEEIIDADLLLHVVDSTHANAHLQAESVIRTLEEINADHLPIVTALNKIDRLTDEFEMQDAVDLYDRAVPISALKGNGSDLLLSVIENELYTELESVTVTLPYKLGRLISMFHAQGQIEGTTYEDNSVVLTGQIPKHLLHEFDPYRK
jgi:GTP-binding protein HflX